VSIFDFREMSVRHYVSEPRSAAVLSPFDDRRPERKKSSCSTSVIEWPDAGN